MLAVLQPARKSQKGQAVENNLLNVTASHLEVERKLAFNCWIFSFVLFLCVLPGLTVSPEKLARYSCVMM